MPPELFGKVRDGGTGPVWILPFYTPERLPRTEVFELPGVHIGDARATSLAIQDMMDDLAADFEFVHPILLPVHTYKDSA